MTEPTMYVFICGPLSDYPSQYLANVAAMTKWSRHFVELDLCPLNPAADIVEGLISTAPLSLEQYQKRSLDLLRLLEGRPAAVFVVATKHRNGSISSGVADEIAEATRLGIPVVYDVGSLLAVRAGT